MGLTARMGDEGGDIMNHLQGYLNPIPLEAIFMYFFEKGGRWNEVC